MDIVDLEYDTIDAKIRNSMDVTNEHFNSALGNSDPSSLRETNVEAVPNVRWILVALIRRPGWSFKRLFNIQWSIPRSSEKFGVSPSKLKPKSKIFEKACHSAPCVLFFDEPDSNIAIQRGNSVGDAGGAADI